MAENKTFGEMLSDFLGAMGGEAVIRVEKATGYVRYELLSVGADYVTVQLSDAKEKHVYRMPFTSIISVELLPKGTPARV